MTVLFAILSILLAMLTALYLLLPTFILSLGYGWMHRFEPKRWALRILTISAFSLFVLQSPSILVLVLVAIPTLFFTVVSFINESPKVFVALHEQWLEKTLSPPYAQDTEVVGVADELGNAIAYPLQEMILPRHLINDVLGVQPVLVSFCAACRSALVYDAVIDQQRLTFEVVGVYRRNMVIRDQQTGTLWQQATGEAMYGKLKGKQLAYLPYQQTTLAEWQQLYPQTLVAVENDQVPKGFLPKERIVKMLAITERLHTPGKTNLSGLPLRASVWGVVVKGKAKAYPVSELKRHPHFIDEWNGIQLTISYNPKTKVLIAKNLTDDTPLHFQHHWWLGWKEFHPQTAIWTASPQV